jgi:hypothetical protein
MGATWSEDATSITKSQEDRLLPLLQGRHADGDRSAWGLLRGLPTDDQASPGQVNWRKIEAYDFANTRRI